MARLPEQVSTSAVFPLQAMDADFVRPYPGPPDALVCGPHQSGVNPTLDVSAYPGVGMPPLFFEAAGFPFQVSRRLHTQ